MTDQLMWLLALKVLHRLHRSKFAEWLNTLADAFTLPRFTEMIK